MIDSTLTEPPVCQDCGEPIDKSGVLIDNDGKFYHIEC